MSMSTTGYGPTSGEAESIATLHRAIEMGVDFLDTADIYGENEVLIAKGIAGKRNGLFIATKCGLLPGGTAGGNNGTPEHIKKAIDNSLRRLKIDVVDLYYLHRVDPKVPVEESMGAFADIQKAGKIRYIGLSEASAENIERAHKVAPITALQSEYSLWTRDPEGAVMDTCRKLGIALVPFSPLGRGFLTGAVTDVNALSDSDFRRALPRFQGDNFAKNKALLAKFTVIATRKGITTAQLAIAWVLAQGDDVIPIPGTQRRKYLEDNVKAADVVLTKEDLAEIDALDFRHAVAGDRYTAKK